MTSGGSPPQATPPRAGQARRLGAVLALNVALIGALAVAGLLAHSVAVLAAGADFLADSLAIVLGLIAVRLRDRHGRSRATTVVALINGGWLLALTVGVLVEAVRRLLTGAPEVAGLPVLLVSVASAAAMGLGAVILGRGAQEEDLHMRSVLLDTVADAASAAAVAVVGAIVLLAHGLYWLDPAAAIAIGLVVGFGAVRLLRDVFLALRTGEPLELDD